MQVSGFNKNLSPEEVAKTPHGYDAQKWKVAREFESMFLNQIMKSMRSTISEGGLTEESKGREIFTEMLDTEYSKMASGQGPGSLSEFIYRQMSQNDVEGGIQKVKSMKPIPQTAAAYSQPIGTPVNNPLKASSSKTFNLEDTVQQVSQAFGVKPDLVHAVIRAESGGNSQAVSPVGAKGLMQLMDPTARDMGVKNSLDPEQNVRGGVKYLSKMLNRYDGDEKLALAAYNAGPGNVDKYGGIPPFKETQNYVTKVLKYRDDLQGGK